MSRPHGAFQRTWTSSEPVLQPPHPEPEVRCRLATDAEVPRTAKALRDKATAAGWEVVATYSRGNQLYANGKPGGVVDCLALRMRRGDERAVAVWVDGKFDVAHLWRERSGVLPSTVGARDLAAAVS